MARKPKIAKPTEPAADVLHGYKAFNADLTCRGFQYALGQTYETKEHPIRCGAVGFHWCENPMDLWSYYDLSTSRFAEVTASGEHSRDGSDTKVSSARLTIGVELRLPDIIQKAVDWMLAKCNKGVTVDSGYASRLAASGNASRLAASGNASSLAASGNDSRLAASGNVSSLAASGYASSLAASGNASRLAASGNVSRLAASGYASSLKLGPNGAGALAWWDGKRPRFTVLYVGEDGIEADVWYRLDSAGKATKC